MSKVYSFRLDSDNPREAKAMEVIIAWVSQGYSLRYIFTEALINYGDTGDRVNDWDRVDDQISELVRELENGGLYKRSIVDKHDLSQSFIDAMNKSAKEGIDF